jgi:AcrR family transcriptional regulator
VRARKPESDLELANIVQRVRNTFLLLGCVALILLSVWLIRRPAPPDHDTVSPLANVVEVAERLFRQIGFQKTRVAEIARELHMSPVNVYRYFATKSEINEAVCLDILGRIEVEAEKIAASRGTAAQRMRNLIGSVEKTHSKLYTSDRKLHELIAAAITENWTIMRKHNQRMAGILEQIIASGMAAGEFHPGDAALAARLVATVSNAH